jgi:RimJ/RimL family protein N-acetyltransferase
MDHPFQRILNVSRINCRRYRAEDTMNDAFPELHTPRLTLRQLREGDEAAVCAYRSLPEVARYQSWDSFTLADAERLIAGQSGIAPDTPGTWFQLAVIETATGALVGDCGMYSRPDDPRQVELGITFAPAHQRRGLATEAVERVLRYVFDVLGKHRVSATTDAENLAAAALLHRLGFRQEGHFVESVWFKGVWGSEYLFALLRREWLARVNRP